jgi:hypothetical protein
MSLMDKMGGMMMGKMDPAEKKAMMDKMMEQFFSNMTPEDKQGMMPKMMAGMMGGKGGGMMSGMMNMMGMMRGDKKADGKENNESTDEMPWDMCKKMMTNMSKTSELATFATPEVRGLFEEWATQIEEEIYQFIQTQKTDDLEILAKHFKLSNSSITYFLTRLANKGKINLKAEKK